MMAHNFQPNTPYGSSPYQPGPYYSMYQQFPPQQQTPTPQYQHPPQQQQFRQPGPFQHSPSFNMGRFDTNSQTTAPPNQNPPFPPSPFNAEMLKQLANSSIPLPPPPNFPPVPIPNMNYPQFPQSTNAAQPSFPPPPAPAPSSADPADDYDPRYPNQLLYNSRPEPSHHSQNHSNPFAPRREEGSSSSKTLSQEGYPHEVADSAVQSQHGLNLDGSTFSSLIRPNEQSSDQRHDNTWQDHRAIHSSADGHQLQRPGLENNAPASTGQAFVKPSSISNYEQTSNKPVNSPSANAPVPAIAAAPADEKSLPELRESAKAALLSLVPHNISFAQVAKEDIDTDLLRKLYEELGIDVDPKQLPTAPPSSLPPASDIVVAANDSLTVPGANPTITEISRPTPAPSPSLERKDRIAQLLAAKTGRPSPIRTVSESVTSTGTSELRQREEPAVAAVPPNEQSVDETSSKTIARVQGGAEQPAPTVSKIIDTPLQVSTQKAVQEPVQASPMSAIPGLFMTSLDSVQTGGALLQSLQALAEDSDIARNPQKRPLEADEKVHNERTAKRRNTDTSGVAMDIDDSDDDASDGEVSEDDTTVPKVQSVPQDTVVSTHVEADNIGDVAAVGSTARSVSGPNTFSTPSKTRLTSAQLAEKAEMLKARFLKQRAERQKQLQEGLPDLEAEVQKTRSRLAKQQAQLLEVRQQIVRLELDTSQAREAERDLVEEISKLEKNLKEGVSGQTKYADELNELNGDPNAASSTTAIVTSPVEPVEEESHHSAVPVADNTNGNGAGDECQSEPLTGGESDRSNSTTSMQMDVELEEPAPAQNVSPAAIEPIHSSPQGVEVVTHEPDAPDSSHDDIEPEIDELQPASQLVEDQENGDEILDYKSDGSASMSDSGSEAGQDEDMEYEPVDADPSHPMDLEASDDEEYDPESVNVSPPGGVIAEEGGEEEYEPSPAEPQEAAMSTPSSGEVIEVSSTAVDVAPALDDQQAFAETKSAVHEFEMPDAEQNGLILGSDITGTLHTDPLPPAQSEAVQAPVSDPPQLPLTNSAATNGTSIGYTPYQSPLSSFQSFRYHEQFAKEPPKDGYRSLTYSNNIDPAVPLCLTELAGGICQNPMCSEQHFRHLGLSGMTPD
jgi:hypothetical protein